MTSGGAARARGRGLRATSAGLEPLAARLLTPGRVRLRAAALAPCCRREAGSRARAPVGARRSLARGATRRAARGAACARAGAPSASRMPGTRPGVARSADPARVTKLLEARDRRTMALELPRYPRRLATCARQRAARPPPRGDDPRARGETISRRVTPVASSNGRSRASRGAPRSWSRAARTNPARSPRVTRRSHSAAEPVRDNSADEPVGRSPSERRGPRSEAASVIGASSASD